MTNTVDYQSTTEVKYYALQKESKLIFCVQTCQHTSAYFPFKDIFIMNGYFPVFIRKTNNPNTVPLTKL